MPQKVAHALLARAGRASRARTVYLPAYVDPKGHQCERARIVPRSAAACDHYRMEVVGSEPGAVLVKLSGSEVLALSIFCGHTARGRYEVMDRQMAESLESELHGVLEGIDRAAG